VEEVLDLLASLVEKSLVVYEEQEECRVGWARYGMLETVRQYASEQLRETGEGAAIRGRHLEYYLGLAEAAEPRLKELQRGEWLERLETEHDNLRVALDWCLCGAEGGQSGTRKAVRDGGEAGLRLAAALWRFWDWRGYLTEGRERLAQALASAAEEVMRGAVGAKALEVAGSLACEQSDFRAARTHCENSLAIKRELGDPAGIADSMGHLAAVVLAQEEYAAARSLYEESLAIRRQSGDCLSIADSLGDLGNVAYQQREYTVARSLYREVLAIRRQSCDRSGIAHALNHLGFIAREQGEYAAARALHEESLAIRRQLGDCSAIAHALRHLGTVALAQGEYGAARSLYEESLAIRRQLAVPSQITDSLNDL
jgi:tetratricopeptide (TPR) repeat protein